MAKRQADETRPGWPAGVHVISVDGLDQLGVDDEGQLYWRGKKVRTSLELSTRQGWGAIVLVASAAILAVIEVLRFFGLGAFPE
jgi:hypothetical protein